MILEVCFPITKHKEAQAIDSINKHFEATYINKPRVKEKERDDDAR